MVRTAVTCGMPAICTLDRDGDVALDLLGRLAGALRDDVDQRRHRIGIGLDVELDEADDAGAEQDQQQQDDQHALLQRKGDDVRS